MTTPQPHTHAVLPLDLRDALVRELERLPMRDVCMVVNALRQAPGITLRPNARPPSDTEQAPNAAQDGTDDVLEDMVEEPDEVRGEDQSKLERLAKRGGRQPGSA